MTPALSLLLALPLACTLLWPLTLPCAAQLARSPDQIAAARFGHLGSPGEHSGLVASYPLNEGREMEVPSGYSRAGISEPVSVSVHHQACSTVTATVIVS